jgi:hypothetical protein
MTKNAQTLSKSRLKRGLQCPKSLYFTLYRKELEPEVDPATQLNFDEGNEVGDKARAEFSDGLLIDKQPWERDEAAEATRLAIHAGATTIFEASFLADGLFARVDILTRKAKAAEWDVIEVKKSGKLKEEHIEDVALQALTLLAANIKVKSYQVMHLNPKCVFPNLKNLFVTVDVTDEVKAMLPDLALKVKSLHKVAASKSEPKVSIGPHCDEPYSCTFRDHCWQDFPTPSVFDLPGVGPAGGWKLIKNGKTLIEDLDPKDFKGKTKTAIEVIKSGKRWIDPSGFKKEIKSWDWPLYFLDFETLAPAIPRYDGCSPYTEVPFQFSCHVLDSPTSKLKHFDYLHPDLTDPRAAIAKALAEGIGPKGSVVAYNMSVERGILEDLASFSKKHSKPLLSAAKRLVDPLPTFRSSIYDAKFNGGFSIKEVAPALIGEDLDYSLLEISDGMQARAVAEQLMRSLVTGNEAEKLRQALLI